METDLMLWQTMLAWSIIAFVPDKFKSLKPLAAMLGGIVVLLIIDMGDGTLSVDWSIIPNGIRVGWQAAGMHGLIGKRFRKLVVEKVSGD